MIKGFLLATLCYSLVLIGGLVIFDNKPLTWLLPKNETNDVKIVLSIYKKDGNVITELNYSQGQENEIKERLKGIQEALGATPVVVSFDSELTPKELRKWHSFLSEHRFLVSYSSVVYPGETFQSRFDDQPLRYSLIGRAQKLVEKYPDEPFYRAMSGLMFAQLEEHQHAIVELERASQNAQLRPLMLLLLAECYAQRNMTGLSIKQLDLLLEELPDVK